MIFTVRPRERKMNVRGVVRGRVESGIGENIPFVLTRPVVVLIHGVNHRERGDSDCQDNHCGQDGPKNLKRRVGENLLGKGAGVRVVKLGGKLEQQIADQESDGDDEEHKIMV